ncbi:hypothetical protein AVEN_99385-1, partial [Araneus ventricosus]
GCQIVKKERPPPTLKDTSKEKPTRRNSCPKTAKSFVVRYRLNCVYAQEVGTGTKGLSSSRRGKSFREVSG